ncbi:transcription termination factor 1, mitochondrial [Colossoma macropomum]|uniref:transcription termination factor 1, mitochondrial n=1 Tax=Colossoma macropomum TaxID=42526 RepID=UPI001864D1B0|nr:transcription termination factor 1, mitochondrial [Colossoma macropomum]XP_036433795.1 transcription termination factor 1, mitochondrial [Colossoma macropomum]
MALQQITSLLRIHHRAFLQPSPLTAAPIFITAAPISITISTLHRFFSATRTATAPLNGSENISLLENLTILGVDLKKARQRQPGVLRKVLTNERGLAEFLSSKGASREVIASIISRFPRAITRSGEHLEERWQLWRSIFQDDAEIVRILDRSPESFFRSSDNENLEKNILFLNSLGIMHRDLPKLLTKAPRVFSNSLELNRTMVELLQSICVSLGGKDHEAFARAIISRNVYILIRSTKRVKANIEFLLTSLKLSDTEALSLFQSHGADILDLSHTSLKRNFKNLWVKLRSLGCRKAEMKKLVLNYAQVLFVSPERLNEKLDCLVEGGIDVRQIVEKPKVLDFSSVTLKQRLDDLNSLGYNFDANGIAILDMSKKRFDAKMEKLREFRH